ncbi:MAG: HEPN domain-containing protein [Cyanobacteria bacterium P01_G01_bin.54]
MKNFEENGVWFLPENPDREIQGTLTFSPESGALLSLIDQLIPPTSVEDLHDAMDGKSYETVNGYFEKGTKVTLYKCRQRGRLGTGLQISKLDVAYVIVDHHFKSLEEIQLKGAAVKYKNLEEWVGAPNLIIKGDLNDQGTGMKKIVVEQEAQEVIELGIMKKFKLKLLDSLITPQKIQFHNLFHSGYSSVKLEESKEVMFVSDEWSRFEELLEVIHSFQDFLTFATARITYPTQIKAYLTVKEQQEVSPTLMEKIAFFTSREQVNTEEGFQAAVSEIKKNHNPQIEEVDKPVQISIYFQSRSVFLNEKKYDYSDVLSRFQDIRDNPEVILETYCKMIDDCKPVTDLYLGLSYVPQRYINDIFFALVQSVEAFHRIAFQDGKYPNKVAKIARKAMKNAIPQKPEEYGMENTEENQKYIKNFCDYLREHSRFSHEYFLNERIRLLVEHHKDCFPDVFLNSEEDQEQFSKKVIATRGAGVHPSKEGTEKENVAKGADLRALIRQLKIFLEICLLRKTGFEPSHVKSLISKKYNF